MSAIMLCSTINSEENLPITNGTFKHLFSIRSVSCNSSSTKKPNKVIYAELFGLSKKVIDSAIKTNMYQELSDMFKTFLYDIQNKYDGRQKQQTNFILNVSNPNITNHKGRPPKRLQSFVEQSSKGKHVSRINISNDENAEGGSKGRRCGRCKQYRHYAKTCQTSMQ